MSERGRTQRGGQRARGGRGEASASRGGGTRGRGAVPAGSSFVGRGSDSPASSEGRGGRGSPFGRGGQDFRGRGSYGGGGGPRGGRGGPPASLIFAANTPARVPDRLSTADQLVATLKRLPVKVCPSSHYESSLITKITVQSTSSAGIWYPWTHHHAPSEFLSN